MSIEAGTDPQPSTSSLLRSSGAVALGTGLSRATGMVRVIVTAVALGGGTLADAFNLANVTPNIVYELVLGGILSATLVPLFVEARERGDRDGPSALFSVGLLALATVSALAIVAAPLLARLYGSRMPGSAAADQRALVVPFLHLLLPQILFYGITTLATAALNAHRRFVAAAFAPVLTNVVAIAVLAFVALTYDVGDIPSDRTGQVVLGLGTTAGIAAMAFALLPALRRTALELRWRPRLRDPMVRRVVRLSGWTAGYVAANQIALVVVLALANGAGRGNVTAYQYAFIFFQLPHGLIAVSVMTTFLPELSAAAARDDLESFRARLLGGMRFMLALVVPAAAGYVVLARPIADALLRHGSYSGTAAQLVGEALGAFAFGLPAFSAYLLVLRGFYAFQDTRTPFMLNVGQNGLNVALALVLASRGAAGLAAAYAISYGVAAVAAMALLHRRVRLGAPALRDFAISLLKILGISLVTALATWTAAELVGGGGPADDVVQLAVAVAVGVAVYVGLGLVTGVEGLAELARLLGSRRVRGERT